VSLAALREQIAVGNFEVRFPLLTPAKIAPAGSAHQAPSSTTSAWRGTRATIVGLPTRRTSAPHHGGNGAQVNLFGLMLFRVD
jgi:hypothetical protein